MRAGEDSRVVLVSVDDTAHEGGLFGLVCKQGTWYIQIMRAFIELSLQTWRLIWCWESSMTKVRGKWYRLLNHPSIWAVKWYRIVSWPGLARCFEVQNTYTNLNIEADEDETNKLILI